MNWKENPDNILFYSTRGDYGCFSNFSKHSLIVDGLHYPTSEHYYQAMKHAGTEHAERIRLANSPKLAAELGRDSAYPLQSNWDTAKEEVMFRAIKYKFSQNPECKRVLLNSGEKLIVENSKTDFIWGCGENGNGKNLLGKCLMKLREEFRNER